MSDRANLHLVDQATTQDAWKERVGRTRYWDPIPGDVLIGRIHKIAIVPGERLQTGIDTPVVTMYADQGKKEVWLGRVSLRRELTDLRPAPDGIVALTYVGLRATSDGLSQYHHYEADLLEGDAIPNIAGEWIAAFKEQRRARRDRRENKTG
jgi:hypothetical protein